MADDNVTIVKKKKVVAGGGHHGGAWKVAYADFVTAMMAFFLLMWLLNATTEQQRKGIADYFSPTIPVHKTSGGGDGPFTGESVFSEVVLPQNGRGASNENPMAENQAAGDIGASDEDSASDDDNTAADGTAIARDNEEFELLEGMLMGRTGESDQENLLLQHIRTRVTEEGLVIELVAQPDQPLFEPGSDTPTERMDQVLTIIARVVQVVTNKIAIAGHSYVEQTGAPDGIDWALSTNRAQQVRSILMDRGLSGDRLARVTGKADTAPSFDDLSDIRNNRIEIILIR